MTHFWHPFADMKQVAGNEIVLDRGEGVWIYDTDGNRYLDASGSLWYANVGHGRRELAEAAAAQLARLEAYSGYDRFATRPALELADRISALAPMTEAVVFFTTAGSDAVESAVKLARRHWSAVGRPESRWSSRARRPTTVSAATARASAASRSTARASASSRPTSSTSPTTTSTRSRACSASARTRWPRSSASP